MAKLLGTIPGFWYYNLQDTEMKGGTFSITDSSGIEAYYDCLGDVPRSDPIVLDSAGVAVTYLDADAGHTILIEVEDGTDIDTVSDVTAIPNPSLVAANLDINGNSIVSASNGDINITADGQGRIVLDGQKFAPADGTNGFLLTTDGSGDLTMGRAPYSLQFQTAPQLGGDLDANEFNVKFGSGAGFADSANNEQLVFFSVTDAINYISMTNTATGTGPSISSAGDDSNIDLMLDGKGSGGVKLSETRMPVSDGVAESFLTTDGSGVGGFTEYATDLSYATQADMEAATDNFKVVTPDNIKYHPGQAKVMAISDSTLGGTTPDFAFNVSSHTAVVSSTTTGTNNLDLTFTFSVNMANTNYAVVATREVIGSNNRCLFSVLQRTLSSCTIRCVKAPGNTYNDDRNVHIMVFGDLA